MMANYPRTRFAIVGLAALALGAGVGVASAGLRIARPAPGNAPAGGTNSLSPLWSSPMLLGPQQRDPFAEMRQMQAQMNRDFNRMFEQFGQNPQFRGLDAHSGYSLSLSVQDLKNHYEVRAFLPDAKTQDVHVSLKNGRTLKVEVKRQRTQTSKQNQATTRVSEWGQYEQVVQLPGPVKADQMKVHRQGHELIITIPKAS